tara:strand:- start:126 stop:257 length:132 start_codon:yes stop_codon:yes gene_type:complete
MGGKIIIKCHYCRKNDSAGIVKEETEKGYNFYACCISCKMRNV